VGIKKHIEARKAPGFVFLSELTRENRHENNHAKTSGVVGQMRFLDVKELRKTHAFRF